MVSDFGHPRTRGGGGVKKGQIFADVLYGWPLIACVPLDIPHDIYSTPHVRFESSEGDIKYTIH